MNRVWIFAFSFISFTSQISPTTIDPQEDLIIRVLLEEIETAQSKKLVITSEKGFILESPMGCGKKYSTNRNQNGRNISRHSKQYGHQTNWN